MTPTKPGYKTTEFWLTAVASLVGLTLASGLIPVDSEVFKIVGFAGAILGSMGYQVSRGTAKKNDAAAQIEEARAADPRRN